MDNQRWLDIFIGNCEEYLLGYRYFFQNDKVEQLFATHSHSSSIKCVSISENGQYLASGGSDDRIFIYDLKKNRELCVLLHNKASINCLIFTNSHLFSGSTNGTFTIFNLTDWQVEKSWNTSHNGASILDIAVHPSNKLALTLGADHSLCTWNLVKGRRAFIVNLKSKCKDPKSLEKIIWAPCGEIFVLFGGKYVEFWSINTGSVVKCVECSFKVKCCTWLSEKKLLMGFANGNLGTVNYKTGKITHFDGHDNRIKCMAGLTENMLITASSNGNVKIWDSSFENKASFDTKCRVTCMTVSKSQISRDKTQTASEEDAEQTVKQPQKVKSSKRSILIEECDSEEDNYTKPNKSEVHSNLDKKDPKKRKKRKKINVQNC